MYVRIIRQRLEECIFDLLSQQSVGAASAEIQPYGTGEEAEGEESSGTVVYYSRFCEDRAGLPQSAKGGPEGMLEIPTSAQVTYPLVSVRVCVRVCVCVCVCKAH